ncbi:putative bifunctional diguanylate cyclase/phosphodiesterase [Agaribacterium haliotis]|uniref:putative bifunctional diguanylate cyclase/phosphodiesterase n=1 Tax=Agaribacterium haliotis TaxID=2013869 RepID=UPI000BB58987|nr:sensor domain-containing phosphodiesterase [Agaribacterium haliotis]
MNLRKKSFLIIVPIIATFFLLASAVVYQLQKTQIEKLERNRLKLALAELDTLYNQYNSFSESYLHSIVAQGKLLQYLKAEDNRYRRIALVSNIERELHSFNKHQSNYLSLTLARIEPRAEIVEYIEFSEDPFSKLPQALRDRALEFIEDKNASSSQALLEPHRLLLSFSQLIDPATLEAPISSQRQSAISVTFALEPTDFINELARYRHEFKSDIRFSSEAPAGTAAIESIQLDQHFYLIAPWNSSILNQRLHPTRIKLIAISALFLISCIVLMIYFISAHITNPIASLEQAIADAKSNPDTGLQLETNRDDEIGRLAKQFNRLYTDLTKAFHNSNKLLQTDHLTAIHNLYQLKRQFRDKLIDARKNKQRVLFAYLDLDNFKFVNDRYGHDIGDKVLIAFSENIQELLRELYPTTANEQVPWTFGRIAGDEFGLVITGSPEQDEINNLVTSVLSLFDGGFALFNGRYPISVSVGLALYPRDGNTPSELISNADTAMYSSKRLGKNRHSFYSAAIAKKIRRNNEVESELKNANFDKELQLVYLPIVACDDLRIWGFEALLRWHSPNLGPVSPAEFVPIAEACGLFEQIDTWVLDNGFAAYESIRRELGYNFVLSLNLSSAQITVNRIQEHIFRLVKQHQIDSKRIQFEMTETTGAEFCRGTEGLLKSINDAGFLLAIDDFGTGYTSIQQLIEYPVSTIKFDKSLLDSVGLDEHREILRPLIELCQNQGMSVTVEGVERREQYEYLKALGADHLQGFLFSRPITFDGMTGALAAYDKKRQRLLQSGASDVQLKQL